MHTFIHIHIYTRVHVRDSFPRLVHHHSSMYPPHHMYPPSGMYPETCTSAFMRVFTEKRMFVCKYSHTEPTSDFLGFLPATLSLSLARSLARSLAFSLSLLSRSCLIALRPLSQLSSFVALSRACVQSKIFYFSSILFRMLYYLTTLLIWAWLLLPEPVYKV